MAFLIRSVLPVAAMLAVVGALALIVVSDFGFDEGWPGVRDGASPTVTAPFDGGGAAKGGQRGFAGNAPSTRPALPPIPPDIAAALTPADSSPTDDQYGQVTPQAERLLYP